MVTRHTDSEAMGFSSLRRSCRMALVVLNLVLWVPSTDVSAQVSPYPKSSVITGVTWDPPSMIFRTAVESDNFSMTWASDGHLYTSWGDGYGFDGVNNVGIGVARIVGEPNNFQGIDLWGVPNGQGDGKSYGLLSVGGVLYMWVGPGSGAENWIETKLYSSSDLGVSWENHGTFFTQSDGFSLPGFLNFGQNYAGARDGYVYSYGNDASNLSSCIRVKLARVPQNQITNRAAYEFLAGFDDSGAPLWVTNVNSAAAVFQDSGGGVELNSVMYNQALGRYLLVAAHGARSSPFSGGGLGIFEAQEPWGPWKTVEYTNNWLGSSLMFFANIPIKWISSDGKTFYLVFTGTDHGGSDPAQDAYQHIRGTFISSQGDTIPPFPPQNLRVE